MSCYIYYVYVCRYVYAYTPYAYEAMVVGFRPVDDGNTGQHIYSSLQSI